MKFSTKFSCLLLFLAILTSHSSQLRAQFIQKGADIDGEAAGDESGYSVSMPDSNTFAVGAWLNNGSFTWAGHVRIYEWNGTNWVQKGADIDGAVLGDQSGFSVSMPDATTVAIGAIKNDGGGSDAGHVRIYTWNGTAWIQKGTNINGESVNDWSGYSICMPNANTVAIGAINNDGNGSNAGHVRIFEWNGAAWVQKGADIDGEAAGDESGEALSMPDANTIAIGAHKNDGGGSNAGHVRIYEWNGSAWVKKGNDIDGEAADDHSGTSVSMPNANTVAIGAINNDGNGSNAGHVRVYQWNGTAWVQKGADIDGEAAGDQSGWSVSMPHINTLAIGAVNNDGKGSNAGHVRIYKWNGISWVKYGADIDGEAANDKSGWSISMPDTNNVAIGANWNDGNGSNAGHVRIYESNCHSKSTINPIACDSYTIPSGNNTYVISGTYMDTIPNAAGCDSVITVNLTINNSNSGMDVITACGTYTWIDGNTYTASNSTATHTLTNIAGCDSVVFLMLTINQNNSGKDSITACDSYTWIDGITYTSSNNTATHTLTNTAGCDSLVTLDLTINYGSTGTNIISTCGPYTWIDGNTYTANNNTATYTLTNTAGCDSIVTLNLLILSNSITNIISACNSYTWMDGNTYTSSNNTATHTLINTAGCDSIVTLDLTINYSNIGKDSISACNSYTWIDGNVYTANNNTATWTLQNSKGCDSIVTLDLTINNSHGTDTQVHCGSFTWINGNTYTQNNNTATFTLANAAGCDSIVTLDLTIKNTSTGTDIQEHCGFYTWIDGNTYSTNNNTATWTLQNSIGCDSIVTLNLTINNSSTGTDIQNQCGPYTWIDGITYTYSNNASTWVLQNAAGCDSTVTLNLTITNLDSLVIVNGITLSAVQSGTQYQWINCDTPQPVSGAQNQDFTPTVNGNYAVIVSDGTCSVTSACYSVTSIGINEEALGKISMYPNPAKSTFTVDLGSMTTNGTIQVRDMQGRLVTEKHFKNESEIELNTGDANGILMVYIATDNFNKVLRLVKTR